MCSDCVAWALTVGVFVVAVLILAASWRRGHREGFSARAAEVARGATEVFAPSCGAAPYAEYRGAVPNADPVQYADVKHLWRSRYGDCATSRGGSLHPDEVESLV